MGAFISWVIGIAAVIGIFSCVGNDLKNQQAYRQTPEYKAIQEKECSPTLVSQSPDGVSLWRVSNSCDQVTGRDVYFSTRGTQTEEHYTTHHRHGSTTTVETVNIPNEET